VSSAVPLPWLHLAAQFVVSTTIAEFGAGTVMQAAWQVTSPAEHLLRHSVWGLVDAAGGADVVLDSAWGAARADATTIKPAIGMMPVNFIVASIWSDWNAKS